MATPYMDDPIMQLGAQQQQILMNQQMLMMMMMPQMGGMLGMQIVPPMTPMGFNGMMSPPFMNQKCMNKSPFQMPFASEPNGPRGEKFPRA